MVPPTNRAEGIKLIRVAAERDVTISATQRKPTVHSQ
jgi:hypothetical protein